MMRSLIRLLFSGLLILSINIAQAEDAPKKLFELVPELQTWGQNPVLVQAVKIQNSKGISLDEIKQQDKTWRGISGLNEVMKEMMSSAAGEELARLERSKPFLFELFLMDNQGANVAMTNKTSDYWQGDEAKFIESYKAGAGAVHVSNVEFDESAQAYLVQVSVPVIEDSKAIGALTIGINLDEL